LVKVSELTKDQNKQWIEMIDLVILNVGEDTKLKEGLKYLDEEALRRKINIYDMILVLYEKSELDKRIKSWKKAKEL